MNRPRQRDRWRDRSFDVNPAERYLSARQRQAEARADLRRCGPLFAAALEREIADEQVLMDQALARMERERGTYDLWGAPGFYLAPLEGS